ncbi:prephenate dehydratase [Methanolobus halotolerans]|uniref:prephenate dehydratase n=1 Tax=Methanolobus halotolerans TaxID=2052935 RepID=A0A4E0Q5U4_9EURY|nr:prephenate dehydratase [Methanolobus halotolerans]TGC09231.1 prephenate dehydratase [Methanolobus halotolerans]
MIIAVLGPKGSYSEKAAMQWLAENGSEEGYILEYCDDIQDVFSSLATGSAKIGITPVENSIEGSVGVTLDMLFEHDVSIIAETVVAIEHCLLSRGRKKDIRIILSHPQGLAQCRQFLKDHFKGVELRTTGSTSHAAKLATEFEEMAAIASRESAQMYGLEVLVPSIQDREQNHTRFLIMIRSGDAAAGSQYPAENPAVKKGIYTGKTSMIVGLDRDRPGALYEILEEFACRKINLTRIESRPSKRALGDYVFYIDLEGHISDDIIKDAIYNIESKVGMLKMLGSYPMFKNNHL